MDLQDKVLTCATCGRNFTFTIREQEFYREKGFIEPKHCRECRQQRKMRRAALARETPVGMEPGTSRSLFEVICAECGKRTQVPFKPLTGKPILCKDCFIQKKHQIGTKETSAFPSPIPAMGLPEKSVPGEDQIELPPPTQMESELDIEKDVVVPAEPKSMEPTAIENDEPLVPSDDIPKTEEKKKSKLKKSKPGAETEEKSDSVIESNNDEGDQTIDHKETAD